MKLTITLSPKEEADIHGWVNKGLADPAFANFPWRIVLEERTRARFDEIAAQFNAPPVDVVEFEKPLAAFETRSIADGSPNIVYAVKAGADGKFSVEISGSPFVTFSVGERGSFADPLRKREGSGTAETLPVKAGEWCNWKYDAVSGGQTMRPQLL